MTLERPSKLLNKNFLLLIAVSLVASLGYSMISTLVSSYAVSFGAQISSAGIIAGIFSINTLIRRPFGRFITDLLNGYGAVGSMRNESFPVRFSIISAAKRVFPIGSGIIFPDTGSFFIQFPYHESCVETPAQIMCNLVYKS